MHAQMHLVQNALDALHRINSLLLLQCQLVNVAIPARMDLAPAFSSADRHEVKRWTQIS
jgi:hypothetical protein